MVCGYLRGFKVLIGSTTLLLTLHAQAAGFYISEVATPGSLGTAGVVNPVNTGSADASWTNPAGMTGLKEDSALFGTQLLIPKVEFDSSQADKGGDDGDNAGNAAVIPAFFAAKKMSDRVTLGFSLVAPQGGAMNFGDNFVGRYGLVKLALSAIGASPAIAYKVNDRLSLGAGVSIVYTTYDQSVALNQGPLPDGKIKFENLDDLGYQPFVGMTYYFSNDLMLGLVYRAEMEVNLEGDLNFRNLAIPTPPANKIDIDWDNPQTLKGGLRYEFAEGQKVIFSAGWEDWSAFSNNRLGLTGGALNPTVVLDRNFKDTWNAGIAYINWRKKTRGYSFGFSYDSSPVSDNNRTIDLPFDETYKLSAAYAWKGHKKLDFAVGASLMYFGEGKVDQVSQGVRFKGKFDTNIALFLGGTLRYMF